MGFTGVLHSTKASVGRIQKLLVRADGTVGNVQILASKPAGVFDNEVLKTVPRWRFEPGRIDGRPVPAWIVTDVRFEMES